MQRFLALEKFLFANGAIGWRPGGPFDCLGPYAKVNNCPIHRTDIRLTCYATGYSDTFFSVPARTRYRGKIIKGYFTDDGEGGCVFRPSTFEEMLDDTQPKTRTSAWTRGVAIYADELREFLAENNLEPTLENMLNGAKDWNQYSWGGSSLIYDADIAERLCSPSELKRTKGGSLRPNKGEEWLDVQARALHQAAQLVLSGEK